jgi:methyl-accepting chemotaxis protein
LARLKNTINQTFITLSAIMGDVHSVSEQIDTQTQALTGVAKTLADSTSSQAATFEEIASSMNEIESKIRNNSENADRARQLAATTLDAAKDGKQRMEEMVQSMKSMNETGVQVTKVIKVIEEIAFQTNLLALNAAVEAARAGKYGKGFAVVAGEVRNLAARSSAAARDTTELIENSVKGIESGVQTANQLAEALIETVSSMEQVNTLVEEISNASLVQNAGINEINKGLSQANSATQQNTAIASQTALATDELVNLAGSLERMMSAFSLSAEATNRVAVQKVVSSRSSIDRRLLKGAIDG